MSPPHPHWLQLAIEGVLAIIVVYGLIDNIRGVLRAERGE